MSTCGAEANVAVCGTTELPTRRERVLLLVDDEQNILGEGGRWLFFTAAPLRGGDGEIIGAIETLQDIT